MSELKPCPFCNHAGCLEFVYTAVMGKTFIGIACNFCGAVTFWEVPRVSAYDGSIAFNKWNNRPHEAALESLVKELGTELTRVRAVAERWREIAHNLAEKIDSISEKMNHAWNPEIRMCFACDICPRDSDNSMEGFACLDAALEWAEREVDKHLPTPPAEG